jgi:hypothetical protein
MRPKTRGWAIGLALALGLVPRPGRAQVVDCVLADVDHQAVTLSDIRIIRAFGLDGSGVPEKPRFSPREVLERVIDRKVVISDAQGELSVTPDKVAAALSELRAGFPPGAFADRLAEFGLKAEDLEPYLEEDLLYRAIIDQRFGRRVAVTLAEIETYYEQTYVPSREKAGLPPEPLVDILEPIEAALRNAKIAAEVRTWIDGLRGQAEVVVKTDCLKILEEER